MHYCLKNLSLLSLEAKFPTAFNPAPTAPCAEFTRPPMMKLFLFWLLIDKELLFELFIDEDTFEIEFVEELFEFPPQFEF